jgi:LacI family transcriptional regulator
MPVTIRDVAKLAGTSPTAVSATLSGTSTSNIRVGKETRERIYAAAAQLGYSPSQIAKSLATGKTKVIGLVLPYADAFVDQNPFCSEVMSGIMHEVVARHYNLMLFTATSGMNYDQMAMLIDSRVEGVLLVMPPDDSAMHLKCERRRIPYVSILRPTHEGAWSVNSDDYAGGLLAAQHLYRLGHRKVAIFEGSADVNTSAPRRDGFLSVYNEAGLEVQVVPAGFGWRQGMTAMNHILEQPLDMRPTAIFAANDLCAEGVMRAAKDAGLRIPEDLAVIGYDDTWFATMTQPPLTTIRMPISEMGNKAASMLIDRLEEKEPEDKNPILPVSLTIRQSCGALAATTSVVGDGIPNLIEERN